MTNDGAIIDIIDRLPAYLVEILEAEIALQSLTLGRRGAGGDFLPLLFSQRIKARFGLEGFVEKKKRIAFFPVKSSGKTKKVADLRFKFELLPGETQQKTMPDKLTFSARVPANLNYHRSNQSLIIRALGLDIGLEITAPQGTININLMENPSAVSSETALLLLSKSILNWRDAPKRTIEFMPLKHEQSDDDEQTHFSELLLVQQRVFSNLPRINNPGKHTGLELEGTAQINPADYCPVLGSDLILEQFRTDILATINSFGYLTTKAKASEGQQFDIRTELNDTAGGRVDLNLEIPDILTGGETHQRFSDAVVDCYKQFLEALNCVTDPRFNSPKLITNKQSLRELAATGTIQFLRIEQNINSDRDLIWMRDLGEDREFDFLFAAKVSVEAYPSSKLPEFTRVCLLAEIDRTNPGKQRLYKFNYPEGDNRRGRLREYFDKIENHQKRLFGAMLHWFDYIDSTHSEQT